MGLGSFWHWLIILLVILILFGAGKLPKVMSDIGRGIRGLKEGMKEGEKDDKKIGSDTEEKNK